MQWVELLPDTQTPSWLGLPNNAERVLLTTQGGYSRPPPTRSSSLPLAERQRDQWVLVGVSSTV